MKCRIQKAQNRFNDLPETERRMLLKTFSEEYTKKLNEELENVEAFTEKAMLCFAVVALKETYPDTPESTIYRYLSRIRQIKRELAHIHTEEGVLDYMRQKSPEFEDYFKAIKLTLEE